ncbi:Aldose 1-epimerase [Triticum urartu]|uniref:Aldose 1-epimerase n=1 Tax=Triticum urartu TaxID=4572 RepID=M7Z895_TRIUA|nr:Aldose 1-epimerase [Triticum urartu]
MARAALLPVALLLCLALAGSANAERKPVGFYGLKNKKGDFSIKVTNWGATLVSVLVPDCQGNLADVVLGYDTLRGYVNGTGSFGATVGRVVNRIAKSRFVLDGKAYRLFRNDGNNSIHGGHRGFGKVIWTVKEYVRGGDTPYITFFYHSFDGEQGFPGDLDVYVTYQLSGPYELSIRMNATATSKATPDAMRKVAFVRDPESGRALELWANQPGVQLYTSNWVSNEKGKAGKVYEQYGALCLETQAYPDAVNHPEFPSSIVRPGQVYKHDVLFKFSN